MPLFHHTVGRRELEQIASKGQQGTAMVRVARDTGKRKDMEWLFELNLAVSPPDGAGFDATFEQWLPAGSMAQGGSTVTVWILNRKVAVDPTTIAMPEPPMPRAPGFGGLPGMPNVSFGSSTTILVNGGPFDPASGMSPVMRQEVEQGLEQAAEALSSMFGGRGPGLERIQALQDMFGDAAQARPLHGVGSQAEAVQLMATGREATAKVLSVTDDAQMGAVTRSTLILQIEPEGEPAFVETLVMTFTSAEKRAAVAAGGVVPVRFDPTDHTKVVLDSHALGF